jgi:hypothetical protein
MRDGLVSVPLRRAPSRDVFAVWRTSADASPALHAVLTQLSQDKATTAEAAV